MSSPRGAGSVLRVAGLGLCLFAAGSLAGGEAANSLDGSPFQRSAVTDSVPAAVVPSDSTPLAGRDSSGAKALESAGSPTDSAAKVPARQLPARTLTLRQQVMFAGGFMAFIALMMASMQNFNP